MALGQIAFPERLYEDVVLVKQEEIDEEQKKQEELIHTKGDFDKKGEGEVPENPEESIKDMTDENASMNMTS